MSDVSINSRQRFPRAENFLLLLFLTFFLVSVVTFAPSFFCSVFYCIVRVSCPLPISCPLLSFFFCFYVTHCNRSNSFALISSSSSSSSTAAATRCHVCRSINRLPTAYIDIYFFWLSKRLLIR